MIKSTYTTNEAIAQFYRETLKDYRINFIEKKKDGKFIFLPTRIHQKRFSDCVATARTMMLERGARVIDHAE